MDNKRAKDIINSDKTIEVLYNGKAVWIDNIVDFNNAKVTFIDSHEKAEVPVYKLIEI